MPVNKHRVKDCEDCSKTNWEGIREDWINNVDKLLEYGFLSIEDHQHMSSFFRTASHDEISCLERLSESLSESRDDYRFGKILENADINVTIRRFTNEDLQA